jgi:cytoskeletal protein RodZ
MPPRGYVYGYLRKYAAAIGLDADDVVLRWQEVEAAEAAASAPPATLPLQKIAVGVAAAVAVAAALAVWLLR